MNDDFLEIYSDNWWEAEPGANPRSNRRQSARVHRNHAENGFRCGHCHGFVYTAPLLSGVQNRNHCPYCLWSRHLDLYQAGDRLAACKAHMQPIGLTLKKTRKKHGPAKHGELMLIHRCVECGKVSINRIAADDNTETVFEIFENSFELDPLTKTRLESDGVAALEAADVELVRAQLLGWKTKVADLLPVQCT